MDIALIISLSVNAIVAAVAFANRLNRKALEERIVALEELLQHVTDVLNDMQ